MTSVYLLAIFILAHLYLPKTNCVYGTSMRETQTPVEWEDPEYWVHIRNVSILDGVKNSLQDDMFVLVIGKHIHKIGKTPMFIMDKDLTFNIDGEGRILLPLIGEQTQPEDSEISSIVEEGTPADLLIIDGKSIEDLDMLRANPNWLVNQQLKELDIVRVIMKDGVIIKNTLPRTRVDRSRLKKVQEKRKKMEQSQF